MPVLRTLVGAHLSASLFAPCPPTYACQQAPRSCPLGRYAHLLIMVQALLLAPPSPLNRLSDAAEVAPFPWPLLDPLVHPLAAPGKGPPAIQATSRDTAACAPHRFS